MIRAIDLFCGGGGSSFGAVQAGATMVGAVDAWDVATRTYADNFQSARGNTICTRLSDASGPEIFRDIGTVDLLIASPECTHHSVARGAKRRCEESRRSGWYVMRFIQELQPRWIVLENVAPMQHWLGFREFVDGLRRHYMLDVGCLDAADFGVPQNRRRLFIIGDRKIKPVLFKPQRDRVQNAEEILDRTGIYKAGQLFSERRAQGTLERFRRGVETLGSGKDFLIVYYTSDLAGGWQPLDRPLRTLTTLDRFGLVQWDRDEPTLRMLQVPELKKAMGLPVSFELNHGTRRDRVKILGNGVCAPVMKSVVTHLIEADLTIRAA